MQVIIILEGQQWSTPTGDPHGIIVSNVNIGGRDCVTEHGTEGVVVQETEGDQIIAVVPSWGSWVAVCIDHHFSALRGGDVNVVTGLNECEERTGEFLAKENRQASRAVLLCWTRLPGYGVVYGSVRNVLRKCCQCRSSGFILSY